MTEKCLKGQSTSMTEGLPLGRLPADGQRPAKIWEPILYTVSLRPGICRNAVEAK